MLRTCRFITLMLAALGLAMGAAHALEMLPKLHYDVQLYMRVTSTLYLYFGIVGGIIQVAALIAAALLAWMSRRRPGFRFALWGMLSLAVSLLLWALLVQPVNAEWARALQSGAEEALQAYARLRSRWEFGHLAAFLAWFVGTALLLHSVLVETVRQMREYHTV